MMWPWYQHHGPAIYLGGDLIPLHPSAPIAIMHAHQHQEVRATLRFILI